MPKNYTMPEKPKDYRRRLLKQLGDAVNSGGGCLFTRKRAVVFADDVCGEMPVVVRRIRHQEGTLKEAMVFDIGDGYTTEHIDNNSLGAIIQCL